MKTTNGEWISDVLNYVNLCLKEFELLFGKSEAQLNKKPSENEWSALECIAHLNRYSEFYLPEIKKQLKKAKQRNMRSSTIRKPGVLGDKFTKSMLPKEGMKKMKTFKSKNPTGSALPKNTLQVFQRDLESFKAALKDAETADLNGVTTKTTLGPLVRFRLGDTLKFYIYHNYRHIIQAKKALDL